MTRPQHAGLLAKLTEEHAAVKSFVALLQQEQKMLTENSIDALSMLAEQKSAEAVKINQIAKVRHNLLQTVIPELTAAHIHDWFKLNSKEGLELWQGLRMLADQAHELNRINGELIQIKLRHNQQLLGALSKAVNQANLYGPNGQTSFSTGTGRSLGQG